jgi:hypothetical protein
MEDTSIDSAATEQPATEQPATEQHATEQSAAEQPAAEQPATEQPATEQPATEQPVVDPPYSGYVDAIVYMLNRETRYTSNILTYTRRTNPKIPIILIGPPRLQQYTNTDFSCEFVDISTLQTDLSYNYTHISPNDEAYEKGRFDRWLLLNTYLQSSPFSKIVYSDFDNAFFADVNNIAALFPTPSCLFVGNDHVSVPNMLLMTKAVASTIENYIRSFYARSASDVLSFVSSLQANLAEPLHYSDIWMLRDVFANVTKSNPKFSIECSEIPNVYRIDKATAPFLVDVDYWKIRSNMNVSSGVIYVNNTLVCNLYFQGDEKHYPYGEN